MADSTKKKRLELGRHRKGLGYKGQEPCRTTALAYRAAATMNPEYSIAALTNSTAAVVERYAYTAYGVPRSPPPPELC